MTSVNDCMLDMIGHFDAMIGNIDVYEGDDAGSYCIYRYTPPGQGSSCVMAYGETDDIVKAAIKCIDIIDKHTLRK